MAPKKKFLTTGKIDRAREALDALSECDDFTDHFGVEDQVAIIEAKNVLKIKVWNTPKEVSR